MQPARERIVAIVTSARVQALACLAAGLVGLCVYAFPGFMSSDSTAQLVDARSRQYTDWHPPAMAAVWTVLDAIIKGPALMLLLQGSLFLLGTFRILRRFMSERTAAIVATSLLWFPPVLAPMGVIWKDSQMAGLLVMAASLLLEPQRSRHIIGIALLTIATAYRDNAAAATLPLLVLLFRTRRWPQRWAQLAIAIAIWCFTVGAALTANKLLTKVPQHAWYVSLGPADIIGVLEKSRAYSDAELIQILDGTPLVKKDNIQQHVQTFYNPYSWWAYMSGPIRVFDWPTTPEQRAAIARSWRTMVLDNPRAYFFHRLRVFRGVLSISRPVFDPVWRSHVDLALLGQADPYYEATGVQAALSDAWLWLAHETPLFRPYLYLLLALVLVAIAWRQREVLALLASGICYELALFFIAPSPDFRYSHWMVVCTVISTVIVVAQRIRSSRRSGDAQTSA